MAANIVSESRTLWIGDVESWMDETYIASLFQQSGTNNVISVKVIRDKNTGLPAGYGFVEFISHEVAQQILKTYNGTPIPGTTKTFRLNWGIFGGGKTRAIVQPNIQTGNQMRTLPGIMNMPQTIMPQPTADFQMNAIQIYVGDLDPHVTDVTLLEFFQQRYKTVVGAKVIVDPQTKYSKGYGFVKFSNHEESQKAIQEMQGALLKGRHIKTSQSFWKSAQPEMQNFLLQQTPSVMMNETLQTKVIDPNAQLYNSTYMNYYLQNPYTYYDQLYPYYAQTQTTLIPQQQILPTQSAMFPQMQVSHQPLELQQQYHQNQYAIQQPVLQQQSNLQMLNLQQPLSLQSLLDPNIQLQQQQSMMQQLIPQQQQNGELQTNSNGTIAQNNKKYLQEQKNIEFIDTQLKGIEIQVEQDIIDCLYI